MALIEYSVLVDELLGSVGGVTFQRGHYGSIARLRTVPTQPKTNPRLESRARLSVFSVFWHTQLTAGQRAAWDALGAATTWVNGLGQNYSPTGHALYVRANCVMDYDDRGTVVVAPDDADEADPGLTIDYSAPRSIRITNFGTIATPPDGRLAVWRSPLVSPGRSFHSGPWVFLAAYRLATLPAPPMTVYLLPNVHPDGHIFLRMRMFRTTDDAPDVCIGRCTHPFFEDVHVASNP